LAAQNDAEDLVKSQLDRAAIALGVAGVVSPLYAVATSFARIQGAALAVIPALGICAIVGGLLSRWVVVVAAGAVFAALAVLQLAQLGRTSNWLDGDASTFAILLALAAGLLAVGLTSRTNPEPVAAGAEAG